MRRRRRSDVAPTLQDVVALARRMVRGRARDLVLAALAGAELRIMGAVDDRQDSIMHRPDLAVKRRSRIIRPAAEVVVRLVSVALIFGLRPPSGDAAMMRAGAAGMAGMAERAVGADRAGRGDAD
jgi:hypothetical protein